MNRNRFSKLMAVAIALLLLPCVSASAEPTLPSATPPAEVREPGHSYGYPELSSLVGQLPAKGDGPLPQAGLQPAAVEAQPKQMDWTPVRRVAVHPTNSQILYAAIHNGWGLWRSTNGGGYWKRLPLGSGSGRTIVFANDNTTALATFGDYNGSYYANGGVYRSPDGGLTWTNVSTGIDRTVVAVAFDPTNPARMYAGTLGAGIYRTTNSGGSWTPINSGLDDTAILSLAVSPSNPSVLYAGGLQWVYRSEDGGDSWYIADNNYPAYYIEAVAVDPGNANTFYAGSQRPGWRLDTGLPPSGFFKSTTGAGNGSLVLKNSGMQDTFVLDIAQDALNSSILYAGTWGSGVYRSDDGGASWQPKNAGLTVPYVYGVEAAKDGSNPVLYAATFYSDGGLFRSTDRGETWTEVSAGSNLYPVVFDVKTTSTADNLVAATSRGVYWSANGGSSWSPASGLQGGTSGIVLQLARAATNASKLLAATYGGGIWSSGNAGQSWVDTSSGLESPYAFDVTFSPSTADTAYAASYGVYRSTDGGNTWSPFGSLPTADWVRALDALGGAQPDLFAGTYTNGVFRSAGAGGSWTDISSGLGEKRIRSLKALAANNLFAGTNGASAWQYTGSWAKRGPTIATAAGVIQIAIDPGNANIVYAATDQGVYRSTNKGETWVPKNQGLGGYGDLVVSGISIDRNNTSTIYLGTWGYGVFKSTNSGDTWTRLSDPLKCSAIYLPVILRRPPSAPPTPTLYEISNPDGDGNYTVSWSTASGASSYTLQEDDNSGFGSPATVYTGSGTSTSISGKPTGTYYYRVRASNSYGSSGWSATRSVVVSPTGWQTIKSENFEGTFPGEWEVRDNDANSGTYYWGKRTCRPYAGSYSGWAVGGGSGSGLGCGSDYPTEVQAWMRYGPFSLVGASDAELTFQLWLYSEPDYDGVIFAASVDGNNFSGYGVSGNSSGWIPRELDLRDVPDLGDLTGRPSVWVALIFISDGSVVYPEGAYVDNLVVRKYVGGVSSAVEEVLPALPETMIEKAVTLSWSD
jgi:photosystem II stability/assembly factor-like uncharacterized protein